MTHKVGNRSNQLLCKMGLSPTIFFKKTQKTPKNGIPTCLLFPPLFNYYDVSKCKIRFEKITREFLMAQPKRSWQRWQSIEWIDLDLSFVALFFQPCGV